MLRRWVASPGRNEVFDIIDQERAKVIVLGCDPVGARPALERADPVDHRSGARRDRSDPVDRRRSRARGRRSASLLLSRRAILSPPQRAATGEAQMGHDASDPRPERSRRVAIIGAGPGGICTGVRLLEAGLPRLRDPGEGPGHRRHVVAQPVSGRRVRHQVAPLLLLVRAEGRLVAAVRPSAGDPRLPRGVRGALRPRNRTCGSAPRSTRRGGTTSDRSGSSPWATTARSSRPTSW